MPPETVSSLPRPYEARSFVSGAIRLPSVPRWLRARPELVLAPLLLIAILTVWELAVRFGFVSRHLLPAPSSIAVALQAGLASGLFFQHAAVTCLQAVTGFAVAVSAGIIVGALVAEFRSVEKVVYPYLVAIQTMPKIALAPLLVVWFGFGMPSKMAVAAIISFFPMLVNTITGMKNCDEGRLDVLRVLGAGRWRIFTIVKLPSALPYIFTGLSIAVVLCLTGTIVGEFVGATAGLGFLIVQANSRMDIPQVFAILMVLGVIGVTAYAIIQAMRRRLLFWAPQHNPNQP